MPKKYWVLIDNEEANELADVISITGRVEGVNCAAKVRISKIQGLSDLEQKKEKKRALARAYVSRAEQPSPLVGEEVTL